MQSEIAQNELLLCIERTKRCMNNQNAVDAIYDQFCKVYYDEMDKCLRHKTVKNRMIHQLLYASVMVQCVMTRELSLVNGNTGCTAANPRLPHVREELSA